MSAGSTIHLAMRPNCWPRTRALARMRRLLNLSQALVKVRGGVCSRIWHLKLSGQSCPTHPTHACRSFWMQLSEAFMSACNSRSVDFTTFRDSLCVPALRFITRFLANFYFNLSRYNWFGVWKVTAAVSFPAMVTGTARQDCTVTAQKPRPPCMQTQISLSTRKKTKNRKTCCPADAFREYRVCKVSDI